MQALNRQILNVTTSTVVAFASLLSRLRSRPNDAAVAPSLQSTVKVTGTRRAEYLEKHFCFVLLYVFCDDDDVFCVFVFVYTIVLTFEVCCI